MYGTGRGGEAALSQGVSGAIPSTTQVPPDVEDAARAAVLREQELSMQQITSQQSSQMAGEPRKRSYDELQAGSLPSEDPAALKVRTQNDHI